MQLKPFRTLATASLATALFVGATTLAAPLWSATPAAHAQTAQPTLRTITVVGDGKVTIEPDVARVNIGVETLNPSVDEATAENNASVDAVLAAMQELGIAGEDQTDLAAPVMLDAPHRPPRAQRLRTEIDVPARRRVLTARKAHEPAQNRPGSPP